MMKKITRIAALLAAGALLFGAAGCSSGGGDGDETPQGPQTETVSYTLTDTPGFESGTLKVSGMNTTDDTSDDTFEMTLKLADEEEAKTVTGTWELTDTGFVCKSDADVTIGEITVNAGESVSGKLNEDNSEITLEVSDVVSLVFVKDEDSGGNTPVEKSFTVDFVGLQSNDFDPAVTFSSEKQNLPAGSQTKVKNVTLYSRSDGSLIVRNANGECTGINYGGSSFNNDKGEGSLGATADTSLYARVIYVPVECAGTLKVTYKTNFKPDAGSESLEDKGQIGAYDADGKLIGEVASVAGVNSDKPLTVNVSAATTVAILYARNGTKKNASDLSGGIDVTKIEFTVAESDGNTGNTGGNTGNTGDNSGNTGDNSGNTGDNSGNTGNDSGNTGNGNENQGGNNESGDQGGEGGGEEGDGEEEDLSSIFTIENGYLNLVADKYEYSLSQTNLKATTGNNAWSAVSGDSWGDNKKSVAPFDTKITVLNMSNSGNRAITLKVKGVSAFRVYVQKETDATKNDRTYKVKINDSNEQTGHNNVDYEDFTTNTTGEATIFIGEASASIYPVGVILYKTALAEE